MGFALRFWACGPAVALVPIGTRTGYFLGDFLGLATCPNAPPVGDARRIAVGDFFGGFGEFLGGDFFGGDFFAGLFAIINIPYYNRVVE